MNTNQATTSAPAATGYRGKERIAPSRTAGSVRVRPAEILKAGFTAICNRYLDNADIDLNKSQKKVLEWVQRVTTGYCREWAQASTDYGLQWTRLPRATFFRARKELVAMGLIELRKSERDGAKWVRLAPVLQPLKSDYIATLFNPFPALSEKSHFWDSESHEWDCESQNRDSLPIHEEKEKPLTEIQTRQQHSPESETVPEMATEAEVVVVQEDAVAQEPSDLEKRQEAVRARAKKRKLAKDARLAAGPQVREKALTAEQVAQAAALRSAGVASPKDERLVRLKGAAAIGRALEELALRGKAVANPGGWLFEAVTSGRYDAEPAVVPTPVLSEAEVIRARDRRASGEMTRAERELALVARQQRMAREEEAERIRLDESTAREIEGALGRLSPVELDALRVRAMDSFRGVSLPEAAIRGAMVGILEADQRYRR